MSGLARASLGRAYTRAWHRATPRSARAVPALPAAPLSTRFGLDRGRPVDRVYIERFLTRHRADIRGRCVEIYEPTYTERFGGPRVGSIDVLDADPDSPRATIHGDFGALPDAAFDCFICTQTLQLIADPAAALRDAQRALAPGGVLLLTVPGISQISPGEDFPDFVRFTTHGLRAAFGDWADVTVSSFGNVRSAAAFLYGMAEEELDPEVFAADDPAYELVVCARVVVAGPSGGA